MLLLTLDTTSDILSVAVMEKNHVLAFQEAVLPQGQGEVLFPMIDAAFKTARKTPADLQGIGVCVGPGSFTGVRIGLAAAKGLGLALNIPVMGATTFEAYADSIFKPIHVVLDTKKDGFWVQSFDENGVALTQPILLSADEIKKCAFKTVVGSGALKLSELTGCTVSEKLSPLAVSVGRVVLSRIKNPLPPEPLYCKEPYVS